MENPSSRLQSGIRVVLTTLFVLLVAIAGYLLIRVYQTNSSLQAQLDQKTQELSEKNAQVAQYTKDLESLKQSYALSEENGSELLRQLEAERNRNDDFENQIEQITGTVHTLDKLSKTDPELLKKYSKVYFLNENYAPPRIKEVASDFRFRKNQPEYVHAQVLPFLDDMLEDAKDDSVDLLVLSGYRSFDEQKGLKSAYTVQYGSGANTFSADQGFSEHQLGTTVDFTTTALNGGLNGFDTTDAYTWLKKNAYRYGFILSYPSGNGYYMYEPWHWRFVGKKLADDLHDDGENFYDMDQRKIDSYLVSIFD